MRILVLSAALALLIWVITRIVARFMRCPKCGKRSTQCVESTRFWKRFQCRRCGHSFVDEAG